MIRRLAQVHIEGQISDPTNRYVMPMSTLIGIDAGTPEDAGTPNISWLLEAEFHNGCICDVQIFKNKNVDHAGNPIKDPQGKPLEPEWVWWGAVPNGRIKSYHLAQSEIDGMSPQSEAIHFNLNAEREEKPRSPAKGSGQARA